MASYAIVHQSILRHMHPNHIPDTFVHFCCINECGLGTGISHTHLSYRRRQVFQCSFIVHKCVRVDLSNVLPIEAKNNENTYMVDDHTHAHTHMVDDHTHAHTHAHTHG